MSRIGLTALVVCLMAPAVAHAADGGVHVYLQPLPVEAGRLSFGIASFAAVGATGTEHPLKLNLKTVSHPDASRQRLLASNRLPVGSYVGFTLTLARAILRNGREETALAIPETPVRIDLPFAVGDRHAPLIWLTLRYFDSIADGVEFRPVFSAVTPSRPIAEHAGYVTNSGTNTITVFDKRVAQAVATIQTCSRPAGMALDQHRRRLYVSCSSDDEVQAIDVATGEIIEHARLSPGDRPRELALTPDGLTLISANHGSNSISFFDAVSLARRERLNVGSGPGSLSIDSLGRRAFVFNTLSSSLSVIDIAGRSVAATLSIEAAPLRGRFNRRGDRLYVIHERSPYMTVLDPRQLTVLTRARLKAGVEAIATDTVRDLIAVGGRDSSVDFYDPNALMPLYVMQTPGGASYMAIDAEEHSLYIVSADTRSVIIARLADRKVVSQIDVGDRPYAVAVMGEK